MASNLWLGLCIVLFAHNLVDLMSDRNLLSYKIVEKGDVFFDKDRDLNYLVCTPFWVIKSLDSLTYEPAIQNVSARGFLNHSIASIEHRLKVTGLFRLNESHISNDHVCFPTTKSELEEKKKPFNKFLRRYGSFLSLFIYSKEKQPNFYKKAYLKRDSESSIFILAYKQKVFGKNYLLNSDCSNRANQMNHDRFNCLNSCFLRSKMKAALYRPDDEGIFDLSEIVQRKRLVKREANNEGITPSFQGMQNTPTTIEGAENCLRKCPESDCFWEVVITLKIHGRYYRDYLQKEGKQKIRLQLNTYVAFYSMGDFYLQLFSLLTLFTGTSVLRLLQALLSLALPVVVQKIEPYLKNEKLLRIFRLALPNLKHALTLLSFVLVLVQGLAMVNEFRFHSSYPNRTSTLNFSSEPFSIVLCFPIENSEGDGEIKEGRNSEILRNFSYKSIEEDSKNLRNSEIKNILIYAGYKQIEAAFKFSDEVLFKSSEIEGRLCLSRCFRVDFEDARHRKMPLTYLWIGFNTKYRKIFFLEKNQNFTSGLVPLLGIFNPQKVTKKYSTKSKKSNCRDYSGEEGCGSRRNCLDRCLSTKFIERHGSIPTNTVVSKSHLNSTMLNRSVYFNETPDKAIEEQCFAHFNQIDCNEARFEESPNLVSSSLITPYIPIRLNYMNIVEKEMEYELLKTLLNIVSLETIFFGSNTLAILTAVLLFFSKIFRLKWHGAYSVCLFLIAFTGFLAHNVLVFQSIISGELEENEFFEKLERYSLPSPILCFDFPEIDDNHLVTGEYLDDFTSNMTFKDAFLEILYSNRTHLKKFNPSASSLNSSKSSNFHSTSELELTHFYYLGLKCFKTNLKVSFKEEDFFLLKDKSVLKLYLKSRFKKEHNLTFFVHQQADSSEIGGGFQYSIGQVGNLSFYYIYSIEFELFRVVREDQFELLKDPRRLFQERVKVNDMGGYRYAMRKRLKEDYNLTTNDLPLERDFDAELNNELYEQHAKTLTDQASFKSMNFEQNVANAYTNVFYSPFKSNPKYPRYIHADFSFSFSFLARRVVIKNSENYTKLAVSFLNTLSLWLEICVLDMGAWFSQMPRLALHLYRLLICTRNHLARRSMGRF